MAAARATSGRKELAAPQVHTRSSVRQPRRPHDEGARQSGPDSVRAGTPFPFTIDEIQYAPRLLSPIKQLVDAGDLAPGAVRPTGSQNFRVMEGVTETLAGRVAILNLLGLSDEEKRLPRSLPPDDYFRRLLETGFPRLRGIEDRATRDLYLSSYMQTYIERDIRELLRIEKRREFETFVKPCALRTGQVVNYHDLGRDANVSPATVKDWLSVLEDGFLIKLLPPYLHQANP